MTCKFRISISLDQINWILDHCKEDLPDLYNQLLLHKVKAEGGLTKPAFVVTPSIPGLRKGASMKEKYDYALGLMNRNLPVPEEVMLAYTEYRYLNDLMTPTEMEEYENTALGDM